MNDALENLGPRLVCASCLIGALLIIVTVLYCAVRILL